MLCWGLIGFAFYSAQQLRLVMVAPTRAPVMFALNSTMLYFGTAAGAAHRAGQRPAERRVDRHALAGLHRLAAQLAILLHKAPAVLHRRVQALAFGDKGR